HPQNAVRYLPQFVALQAEDDVLWTARRFEGNKVVDARYFSEQSERDAFVLAHAKEGWKKRGKICRENLSRHLVQAPQDGD
ncbi:MAG: hypothetical protein ACI4OJ_00300, partial [Lachnospiraceae bacterium]